MTISKKGKTIRFPISSRLSKHCGTMLEPLVKQTSSRVNATETDSTHQDIQAVMVSAEPAIQKKDANNASCWE